MGAVTRQLFFIVASLLSIACGDESGGTSAKGGAAGMVSQAGTGASVAAGTGGDDVGGGGGSAGAGSGGQIGTFAPDGSIAGFAGGPSEAGAAIVCGKAAPAEVDPPVHPDAIAADSGAVTTLNDGDVDQAATNVTQISAGAGMSQGTQGPSTVWKWKQAGAFLEYSLKAVTAGTYTVNVVYFAAQEGGAADVLLNGASVGKVTFGTTVKVGGYGGIPNGLSRGLGTAASLVAGTNKVRIAFTPRSTAVDVLGLQVNYSGRALPDAAKIQRLSPSAQTALRPDAPSDFYRIHYTPSTEAWNCQRSYCLVEYLVEAEMAGAYALTMKYAGASTQCSGLQLLVDGQPQTDFQLPPGSGVTPPKTIHLPCGVSRLTVRNANYLTGGEYCAYGAEYGEVDLKPVP
jgi:hypothetical protein